MAVVLDMAMPVIEFWDERRTEPCPPGVLRPERASYARWMAAISEGFCPVATNDDPHRLEPFVIPETGEVLLRCGRGVWFRLVYPNELEQD